MSNDLLLADLIGNEAMKTQLTIASGAARLHNRAIPHILFSGQAGCGKTSTARALAYHSKCFFMEASAEGLKSAEDIAKVFEKFPAIGYDLTTGDKDGAICPTILFIDEAHRLSLKSEEMLGIAMENFRHTYTGGRGRKKEILTTWVPEFTLVCATTMEGRLSKPFRDRFKLNYVFGTYTLEESLKIVRLHAALRGIEIDDESVLIIARRSRGTPRWVVRYLERVHDTMVFAEDKAVTPDLVLSVFELMGIDERGLTKEDTIILKSLFQAERPVGVQTLSLRTHQDEKTITEVNEPYLLTLGLMERGPSGRVITEAGIEHLAKCGHIDRPGAAQDEAPSRVLHRKKI